MNAINRPLGLHFMSGCASPPEQSAVLISAQLTPQWHMIIQMKRSRDDEKS
jgi:hypothetical protein